VVQRFADFDDVVRRDGRCHADRDPRGSIGQQVRESSWQNDRLCPLTVIGIAEIDGVLVDPFQQPVRGLCQACLGIAHGRRVIAVDIAEIPLSIDQRVAHGEILRQTHHGVINRLIAMGVILTHDIADDARTFLEPTLRVQFQFAHGKKQPAMDRL